MEGSLDLNDIKSSSVSVLAFQGRLWSGSQDWINVFVSKNALLAVIFGEDD